MAAKRPVATNHVFLIEERRAGAKASSGGGPGTAGAEPGVPELLKFGKKVKDGIQNHQLILFSVQIAGSQSETSRLASPAFAANLDFTVIWANCRGVCGCVVSIRGEKSVKTLKMRGNSGSCTCSSAPE
jgi:hypothetical protein